jgi:hypothetical protein
MVLNQALEGLVHSMELPLKLPCALRLFYGVLVKNLSPTMHTVLFEIFEIFLRKIREIRKN